MKNSLKIKIHQSVNTKNRKEVHEPIYIQILSSFKQFSGDLAGVFLVSLGLLSFFGLIGWSQGFLIDYWTSILKKGFGWGADLIASFFVFLGILILFRRIEKFPHLNLRRLLALEGFIFSVIALLAIFGGFSIERAEIGADGGIVGWGLVKIIEQILPVPFSTIFLFLFTIILLLMGLGIWSRLFNKIKPRISASSLFEPRLSKTETDKYAEEIQSSKPVLGGKVSSIPNPQVEISSGINRKANEKLPGNDILLNEEEIQINENLIHSQAIQIEKALADLRIPVKVAGYRVGPTIIQYAIELGNYEKVNNQGEVILRRVKMSKIKEYQKDIALAMAVERLRVETPIPGHAYVGIEVPNQFGSKVRIRSILESNDFKMMNSPLGLALGLDVSNHPVVADLARMPHILIGGTTGSGKSVCINGLATCLLMNNSPVSLRLIMLDPKKVELVHFEGIPHLIGQVETESNRMGAALQWAVGEMDRRFKLLEGVFARDLDSYNLKMQKRNYDTLPRIVILIDELADLMVSAPEQTELTITRLAQMARATGIHLVVSTQRPSTNIITGLIKSNFPARISFLTASQMDSRVILDLTGAENLLGKGDLLFLNPEVSGLQRAQAPMVEDIEIRNLVDYWKNIYPIEPAPAPWENMASPEPKNDFTDNLLNKAIRVVQQEGKASASLLQRRLNIGYPRAARLIDELESKRYVGPAEVGGKEREVFYPDANPAEENQSPY